MPSTFQRTPYDNSRSTQTIAELMGLPAQIAAQAVRDRAAAVSRNAAVRAEGAGQVGRTIQNATQQFTGTLGDILRMKQDAPIKALEAKELENRVAGAEQQRQDKVLSADRAKAAHQALVDSITEGVDEDAATGARTVNHEKVIAGLQKRGFPELIDDYAAEVKSIESLKPPPPKLTEHDPTKDLIDPTGKIVTAGVTKPKDTTFGAPYIAVVNGKRDLVRPGSDGKLYDTDGKLLASGSVAAVPPRPVASGDNGNAASGNVRETVLGMMDGTLPPILPGRATKEYLELTAEAHRQKFDLAGAATDWLATQKHISTMNGAQQLRLNQAINSLPDMLDSVASLAAQWKGGRFPLLNKANLIAAKNGAFGNDVASVANRLDAQIADVTADLGNVYMGGNSPTDHALGLAGKSLKGEWSEQVLKDMVALAKKNVQIRKNSINNTGVAGASDTNQYAPAQTPTRVYYDANGNPK